MRKLGKATMAVVLSMAMVMGNMGVNFPACQTMQQVKAETDEIPHVEVNEEFDAVNEFYFTLNSCGSVSFEDSDGNLIEISGLYRVSEDGNMIPICSNTEDAETFRLGVGTYKVEGYYYNTIGKIVFIEESADSYEQEWNDTIDTANEIKVNTIYTGKLNYFAGYSYARTEDVDYYKVNLDKPGKVRVQYTVNDLSTGDKHTENENIVTLYSEDADGNTNILCEIGGQYSEDKTRYSGQYRLPKGTYYIGIKGDDNYYGPIYGDVTDYQLKVNYTEESADKYEQEYNDTLDTANPISTNSTYTGNISEKKDVDYFTFTLYKKSSVKLKTSVPRQSTDKLFTFGIYKSNGTSKVAEVKSGTNPTAYTTEKELEPGIYYVIVKKGDAEEAESEVDYSINVMATEVEEIVETPTPKPTLEPEEEEPDFDDEQMEEDVRETAVPNVTRQPENPDGEEEWESEEEAPETPTSTRTPATTAIVKRTSTPIPIPEEVPTEETTEKPGRTASPEIKTTPNATNAPSSSKKPTLTAAPTEEPDLIQQIRLFSDLDDDEELRVGDKFYVFVEVVPDEMNEDLEIIWKSGDSKVATISKDGEVTCKGVGTVTISATTTDGSKLTVSMKFTIKRALSKVNTLSKITFTQGKLTPNFTKAKTSYTLTLGRDMSSTIIRYQKTDSASTVKINGSSASKLKVKLKQGESKVVKITVKAENGNKKTYKIKVRRKR